MECVRHTVGTWACFSCFFVTSFICHCGLSYAGVWMICFYVQVELRGGECNSEDLVYFTCILFVLFNHTEHVHKSCCWGNSGL